MNSIIKFAGRISAITERSVTLPDGKVRIFEYAERPPGVRLLVHGQGKFLLTREWRDEQGGFDVRIPGGKVFDTFAEYERHREDADFIKARAHEAAIRELQEETGLLADAAKVQPIKVTECGATVIWKLHYFLVETEPMLLKSRIATHEGELIEPSWVTPEELFQHCLGGEMKEDRTAAVIIQWLAAQYSNLNLKG